ncbi:small ribosomal subunit protein mS39-like [Ptychodera flava]|uniref:small ribosomal subunit protein mS39-like n=1 Tax=Ptychodera flava TaxID=63121 RepID=UPI00396A9501
MAATVRGVRLRGISPYFPLAISRITRQIYCTANLTSDAIDQNTQEYNPALLSKEEIILPRRKKRDSTAVLQALASTVGKDPTAKPYIYHDDSYLLPYTGGQSQLYALASESGKKAAEYVMHRFPEIFTAIDHDEPKIACLYPKVDGYIIEDACEEGLLERVNNRDIKAAMEMYDKITEGGGELSLEASNCLLDMLCFYAGQEPREKFVDSSSAEQAGEDLEEGDGQERKPRGGRAAKMAARLKDRVTWQDGNYAEKVFNSMQERDGDSYCSMIRGMAKHGASARAFEMYNEMQDKDIKCRVEAYNALISAVLDIRESYTDRWQVVEQLLKQMKVEDVQPTLATFNSVLSAQVKMGAIGRKTALQTISEMKAIGITPTLASYSILLAIFYKPNLPLNDMLYDIIDEIEGKTFPINERGDTRFFVDAMRVCERLRDVNLAHRLNDLANVGDHHRLLGNRAMRFSYYNNLFSLTCQMSPPDKIMEVYKTYVPSAVVPNLSGMMDLLNAVEMYNMQDKLPDLWQDSKEYGHIFSQQLIEQLLYLMAKDDFPSDLQQQFGDIAMDICNVISNSAKKRDPKLQWGTTSLGHIVTLCLKAKRLGDAWTVMRLFKENHKVPGSHVVDLFLDACIEVQDTGKAIGAADVVISAGLSTFPGYIEKIKKQMNLSAKELLQLEEMAKNAEEL